MRVTDTTLSLVATDEVRMGMAVPVRAIHEDGEDRLQFKTPFGWEPFASTQEAVDWFGPMQVQDLIRHNARHGEIVP